MDYGTYLREKTRKLQEQADEAKSSIFAGCNIYITGHTRPPLQELRRLITSNGGLHAVYFTGTQTVTHIVSSGLTARKREQFSKFRVVKPEWIIESIREGRLLAWSKYRTIPLPAGNQKLSLVNEKGDQPNLGRVESCLDPRFIESFYSRSRLHHLSTWKSELKTRFQTHLDRKLSSHENRFIIHVDFDSFFVSVALQRRPHLADKPVCVSNGGDSADVASCNYIARSFGVQNGMWVNHAKKLCPDLVALPYEFREYEIASTALYQVLSSLNAEVFYPISVDEAILDITTLVQADHSEDTLIDFASDLRAQIRRAAGIEASVGIGPSILAAKMALKRAKPGGQAYLSREMLVQDLSDMEVTILPGIGRNVSHKLGSLKLVKDVRNAGELRLQDLVGAKLGTKLWKYSNGIDDNWEWLYSGKEPKSVGVDISWGVRLANQEEVQRFVSSMASELHKRFKRTGCQITGLTAKLSIRSPHAPIDPPKFLGHGECDSSSASRILTRIEALQPTAKSLIMELVGSKPPTDIRGIGLTLKLTKNTSDQLAIKTLVSKTKKTENKFANKDINLSYIEDWISSQETPHYGDVSLIEQYILEGHWTQGYEVLAWMRRIAPQGQWQVLVNILSDKLNEKVKMETGNSGYVEI